MKESIFRYIFILVIIVLMGLSIYQVYDANKNKTQIEKDQNTKVQKVMIDKLILGIAEFDTLNPIVSQNRQVQEISKIIYEPLITLSYDYKTEASLATEWSKISRTSYLVKLRENVKWQDGSNFTADDVHFTVEQIKNSNSIYLPMVEKIEKIEIIDEYTLKINLIEETMFFEYYLTFPIISKAENIGTGKYTISNIEENNIFLEENKSWWNRKEDFKLKKVTINLYDTIKELYIHFKEGKVDLISTSNPEIKDYIGKIGFHEVEYKGREYDFLALHTTSNILENIEVRKAIYYAINKENLIAQVYENEYYNAEFPLDYNCYLYSQKQSTYNTELAKQLLEQNGWEYKNKGWQKWQNYRTYRIQLNLVVNASNEKRVLVAENIKKQLEDVGIIVNVINATEYQYNQYLVNKNYDMILTGVSASYIPTLSTYFGEDNLAEYENQEIKAILNAIDNIYDENLLKEKYNQIQEIYTQEIPYISLYFNKGLVLYSKNFKAEITPNWYNIFYNIERWYGEI